MAEFFYLGGKEDKNKRLVAGLFWHPVAASTDKARKAEAQEVADQMKLDAVVWRHGATYQAGLAGKDALGACAAAALVSKTIEVEGGGGDFICAAQVPDGRWLYVAQKDGVLLPDGDMLGSEDEVRSRMLADFSAGHFALVYAPDHWGVPAKAERDFLSFIPQKKGAQHWHKWWRMQPVRVGLAHYAKTIVAMLVVAGVLAGGVVGWKVWNRYQEQKRIEAARIAAEAAAASAAAVVVKPWAQQPLATSFARACAADFGPLRASVAGWELATVACSVGDGVSVVWKAPAVGGSHSAFVAAIPQAVVSPDGSFATLTRTVAFTAPESAEDLQPAQPVIAWLMDRASHLSAQFKVQADGAPATAPAPGAPEGGAGVWKTYAWSMATGLSPQTVIPQINTAGLRVTKIMFSNDQWSIEGVLYAN